DERAVAGGLSRAQCRRAGRAHHLGEERAADHRTRATRVLPPRPSDHVAAVAADSRARLGGTLEMGDPAAHENGIAPADGDLGDVPNTADRGENLRSFPPPLSRG